MYLVLFFVFVYRALIGHIFQLKRLISAMIMKYRQTLRFHFSRLYNKANQRFSSPAEKSLVLISLFSCCYVLSENLKFPYPFEVLAWNCLTCCKNDILELDFNHWLNLIHCCFTVLQGSMVNILWLLIGIFSYFLFSV